MRHFRDGAAVTRAQQKYRPVHRGELVECAGELALQAEPTSAMKGLLR